MRLIGNVSADPQTGQLTTTIADTPQVPFTSFDLELQRRRPRGADQPADLRPEPDGADDDPLVGQPAGAPRATSSP